MARDPQAKQTEPVLKRTLLADERARIDGDVFVRGNAELLAKGVMVDEYTESC